MSNVVRFPQRHARASSLKPNTTGDASRLRAASASRTTKKLALEIRPRITQLLTAEGPTPQSSATFVGPPNASITESIVPSMAPIYSHFVESSILHRSEIATPCEQWLNSIMISERNFHVAVGDRLRKLRLGYGATQSDFAKVMGVGGSAMSNYEAGTRAVDPYAAYQLKNVYNAPLEWLYCGDESTIAKHVLDKIKNPSSKKRGAGEPKVAESRQKDLAAEKALRRKKG